MQSLISSLIESGAPWGLLCAILLYAVIILWKKVNNLSDKLFDLSKTSIEKDERIHPILKELIEDINLFKKEIIEEVRKNKNVY